MNKVYALGVDVGSTTVKTVILDENKQIIYSKYERHFSKVKETVRSQLEIIQKEYPDHTFKLSITGSAGLGLATASELPFVQEVFGAFIAVKESYPDADVVIELGGEDAKIIFLTGGVEQRMNGTCAGGTGAFIDQMATLLKVSGDELDELALQAERVYPIASRCGVFAKSDIQPLLNQGADRRDVAASIFQAVVDQTVAGLAQGRRIKGTVLFLGGPLHFYKALGKAFKKTLNLDDEHAIFPSLAPCFVAYGAALYAAKNTSGEDGRDVLDRLLSCKTETSVRSLKPLFENESEYSAFVERHKAAGVKEGELSSYRGGAYLGVDAGSTTTKVVLIGENNELLYSYYGENNGKPLDVVAEKLKEIYALLPSGAFIRSSAVTGYGEELIKSGLKLDYGLVETVAHFNAAVEFCPDVDFIIDIGGQDIKCFKIRGGAIDNIMLNEACSSGCGSFIQTFANALGYGVAEFSSLGLYAKNPVDLGSRCTVFMNSSVKQAQKDGASVDDISAGISVSVVKNAVYKVIRARSADELGRRVVVQGGTFLNDAVLRAFENELGLEVIRPVISGLMGAYGAALFAKKKSADSNLSVTSTITSEELDKFSYTSSAVTCNGCTARCRLSVVKFSDGRRQISGNRCDKGAGKNAAEILPDMYSKKYDLLRSFGLQKPQKPIAKVGLPVCLNFYEQLPLWRTCLTRLGFEVVLSDDSSRKLYLDAQHTVPSDTVCYPAKLVHGHVLDLLAKGVDFIFYPCQSYNFDEHSGDNHYNCPVVAYYPELLAANIGELNRDNFVYPYMDMGSEKNVANAVYKSLKRYGVTRRAATEAVRLGYAAQEEYRKSIREEGRRLISYARRRNLPIIVLAGRPYHVDSEINHGINKLISSLGVVSISEDAVCDLADMPKLHVLNQWTYHSRMYRAAAYVATQSDMNLVQLVSFGCGIDAVTTDEVRRILEQNGKIYTQLKIDEISNLGAVKIRLRSLLAAIE